MSRFEPKNPLEREADRILAADTSTRRSGLTAYTPRPEREVLSLDGADFRDEIGVWDEYPSDQPVTYENNIRARAVFHRAAAVLTDKQMAAIEAVVLGGLSYGEAAKYLGVAKGTVHDHVQTGLRRLRESMEGDQLMALLFPELDLMGDQ